MKNLVIVGAGGFAREAYSWINQTAKKEYLVVGFYDEFSDNRKSILGLPVLNNFEAYRGTDFLPCVGDPNLKLTLSQKAHQAGLLMCTPIIHHSVTLGEGCRVGNGTILCPNVVLTMNVTIGHGVIVNLGVTVGHDAVIEDFTTLSPGANISGGVNVGLACYIGTNACIREKIDIGSKSIVGMGAVVTKPVLMGKTVIGNPAREKYKGDPNEKNVIHLRPDGPHAIQP